MSDQEAADAAEQGTSPDVVRAGRAVPSPPQGEGGDADLLEQASPVDEEQLAAGAHAADNTAPPADAPEADWLDQQIVEPIDEERR